ncbi:unnamed protein product, partial [Rotaria magnacalcarata]
GSVVPLSIVYVMRPDSLNNLFDLVSSSLLIAFNWSEGVAQRFNLIVIQLNIGIIYFHG